VCAHIELAVTATYALQLFLLRTLLPSHGGPVVRCIPLAERSLIRTDWPIVRLFAARDVGVVTTVVWLAEEMDEFAINIQMFQCFRTVSRSAGEDLAAQYDCAYFETSAAEDYTSVSAAFGRLLTDAVRLVDRQPALQSLFISEDRYKASPSKIPTTSSDTDRKDDAAVKQQLNSSSAGTSRRSAAAFKLFNKIFN
jgi:hypothetical protein